MKPDALTRMRTMVISAIGMYVFIVVSMNVYPLPARIARRRGCLRLRWDAPRGHPESAYLQGNGRVGLGFLVEAGVGRCDSGVQFAGGAVSAN
jgi:hypothetical protein